MDTVARVRMLICLRPGNDTGLRIASMSYFKVASVAKHYAVDGGSHPMVLVIVVRTALVGNHMVGLFPLREWPQCAHKPIWRSRASFLTDSGNSKCLAMVPPFRSRRPSFYKDA